MDIGNIVIEYSYIHGKTPFLVSELAFVKKNIQMLIPFYKFHDRFLFSGEKLIRFQNFHLIYNQCFQLLFQQIILSTSLNWSFLKQKNSFLLQKTNKSSPQVKKSSPNGEVRKRNTAQEKSFLNFSSKILRDRKFKIFTSTVLKDQKISQKMLIQALIVIMKASE